MIKPTVSVIMAAYNADRYLANSMDSVLGQTYEDFQFLIVDDGCNDDSLSIIQSYADRRIKVIQNQENIGQTRSLNVGLTHSAASTYIARVDADDVAGPMMLERMIEVLEDDPYLAAVSSARNFIDQGGAVIGGWMPPITNPEIQQALMSWNCLPLNGAVVRAAALRSVGGYRNDYRYAQDYELALRLTDLWNARNIDEPLYSYRWHDQMVSSDKRKQQDEFARRAVEEAIRRRLIAGWSFLGIRRSSSSSWIAQRPRSWVAERYTWWSAGSRGPGRFCVALEFLLIAILASATYRPAWSYIGGAVRRKASRGLAHIPLLRNQVHG